ncbi:MAG: hypothetical protein HC896_11675 [Bacteroidales bacterium]|nr:hypothetical protein [Bacteroidales bacterium]
MKELKSYPGGVIRRADDWIWMQNGLKEAISAICKSMAKEDDAIMLSGCEYTLTGTNLYSITAGFLWWDGEIYEVQAATDVLSLPVIGLELDTDQAVLEDPTGDRLFGGTTPQNIYHNRTLKLVNDPQGDYLSPGGLKRFTDFLNLEADSFRAPSLTGTGWNGTISEAEKLKYRLTQHGELQIAGNIKAEAAPGNTMFTLLSGYRPSGTRVIMCHIRTTNGAGITPVQITIGSNGVVERSQYESFAEDDIVSFCHTIPL